MFFDIEVMNELQPLWKLANHLEINKEETMDYSLKDVCTKLDKIVRSVDNNCAKRLALRPSSTLVSGAIELYKQKVNQLCFDSQILEREITQVNYKTQYHTESSDTETNSSTSTVNPEEMMRPSKQMPILSGSSQKRTLPLDEQDKEPRKKNHSIDSNSSGHSNGGSVEKSTTNTETDNSNKCEDDNQYFDIDIEYENDINKSNEINVTITENASNIENNEIAKDQNENKIPNETYLVQNDQDSVNNNTNSEINRFNENEASINENTSHIDVVNDINEIEYNNNSNKQDYQPNLEHGQEELNKSTVSEILNNTVTIDVNRRVEAEQGGNEEDAQSNQSSNVEIISDTSKSSESSSTFDKLLDGFPYAMIMLYRHKRSKTPCRIMYTSVNPFIFEAL